MLSLPEAQSSSPPFSVELSGAILFLDVCGFTQITELAHTKGRYGIEIITGVLNNYFEMLSHIIEPHGGEILKYGGDSCLAVFPGLFDKDKLMAIGTEIEALVKELDLIYKGKYNIGFGLHGGFTFGRFTLNIVGSRKHHLDYFPSSPELGELYTELDSKRSEGFLYKFPKTITSSAVETQNKQLLCCEEHFLPKQVAKKLNEEDYPAELRNAAVIFTHLSSTSGSEIPLQDYQHFYTHVQRWVYEFGGVINKIDFTEKGYLILILFGVPEVHAEDTVRAFLCALRIVQIPTSSVQCRIGITYSNIYSGVIGSSTRYEYGIIGNAVNIAARLMSYAKPGQIALSKEIIPAIRSRFETSFVETTKIKGIQDPVDIYLLESELPEHWSAYSDKFSQLPFLLPPKDGAVLQTWMETLTPGLLRIKGAAGNGKSYLIWLIFSSLHSRQLTNDPEIVVADKASRAFRLEFFFSLLRRKLGISSFKNEFALICEYAAKRNLDWNADLINSYIFPQSNRDKPLSIQETQLAISLLTGICFELLKESNLLLIDNLDYYDTESLLIVQGVISQFLAKGARVAYSSSEPVTISLPDGFPVTELELGKFSFNQSTALITGIIPLITKKAIEQLHAISEGNPQFLVELLMHLQKHINSKADLIGENTLHELQSKGLLPPTMENLLMSLYQAIDPPARQLLKCAAIYGCSFSLDELHYIFRFEEDSNIALLCEKLVLAQFLELRIEGTCPTYQFSNPLMQDCIYRSVLLGEKRSLHHQIADTLAARTDRQDDLLQSIVHHYLQAEDEVNILYWSSIAAEKFFNMGAWDSSKNYYQILYDHSHDIDARTDAQLRLIEILLIQANNSLAKQIIESLPSLAGLQHEKAVLLKAMYLNNVADYEKLCKYLAEMLPGLTDSKLKALTYNYYLESLLFSRQITQFFKEANNQYQALGDNPAAQNNLAGVIAQAYMNQGDYQLAADYYDQKLSLSQALHDPLGMRIATNGLGGALSRMGKKQEALAQYTKALEIAESIGDRNGYSKVMLNLGVFYRNEMDYAKALDCYQKSLLLAKHIGNLMQESIILYDMGELLVYQDDLLQALPLFNQSLDIASRINDFSGISFCNDAIGDIHYKRGEYYEAEAVYLSNLKLQKQIHDKEGMAHTWGNLGNCAKVKKDYKTARKYYYKQLTLLSTIQDWDGAGRARFNLAMINRELGFFKRSLYQLHLAKELFSRCEAKHYLQICLQQEQELLKLISK